MPFRLRTLDEGRVLLVRAVGAADAADWHGLRERLPDTLRDRCGLLVDMRRRSTLPTAGVARAIGRRFDAEPYEAIALVARPGAQFGLARSVDILAGVDPGGIRTFTELRAALNWLRDRVE